MLVFFVFVSFGVTVAVCLCALFCLLCVVLGVLVSWVFCLLMLVVIGAVFNSVVVTI